MSPALMLVHSPDTDHVPSLTLPEGSPVVVGRAPTTHGSVAVDDLSMSREHFRVFHNESGELQVEDLNSTNGVLVGDRMLRSESIEIVEGEVLRAGDSIWVAVSSPQLVSKGFFMSGGEEWVGYSARLLEFKERLDDVQVKGPIWLTGCQCRSSQLKVARALASSRGLKLQVDGASPEKGVLWFTSEDSVGKHQENTVIAAEEIKEVPSGFQQFDIPSILEQAEDRLLLFEDIAHRWTDELMYRSVDIPYSLFRWDSCSDLSEFEFVIKSMIQMLRPMEVLDESHLETAGIKVVPYGEGEKRLKPTKEELVNALVERGGSVRATADLYNVQRTQVYRWMRAYAINIEELREG